MRFLVLGGTQFIGRHVVDRLLNDDVSQNGAHEIFLLNRGKSENPFKSLSNVHHYQCDRSHLEEFRRFLETTGNWDAVIDLTSMNRKDMEAATAGLKGRVGHYVYISSDSVYMACGRPLPSQRQATNEAPALVVESDVVRPATETDRLAVRQATLPFYDYGSGKLEGEEVLRDLFQAEGFPYTALRLPDVFGEWDNCPGHLRYQTWVETNTPIPLSFPFLRVADMRKYQMSVVYVKDVAAAIVKILHVGSPTFGQAMHIASDETPTLIEYLEAMANLLGSLGRPCSAASLTYDPNTEAPHLPSVDCGALSIEKAQKLLPGWQPTPMREWLPRVVKWYVEDPQHRAYAGRLHTVFDGPMTEANEEEKGLN